MPLYTQRNNELVQLLAGDFQRRYEPNFAWVNACACISALPGLRGFWPMSTFDSNADAYDQSGHGHTLTAMNTPQYVYWMLAPFVSLASGDYLRRLDEADLDIIGTETYVPTAWRGIALGGWFYATTLATSGLITKWVGGASGPGANQSYLLSLNAAGTVTGTISDAAGNLDSVTSTSATLVDEWFFAAFTWSGTASYNTMSVWISDLAQPDGLNRVDAATARASIRNSTADFCVGGFSGGTSTLAGRASMCWLCAMCHTPVSGGNVVDALVSSVFQQTRALYGR